MAEKSKKKTARKPAAKTRKPAAKKAAAKTTAKKASTRRKPAAKAKTTAKKPATRKPAAKKRTANTKAKKAAANTTTQLSVGLIPAGARFKKIDIKPGTTVQQAANLAQIEIPHGYITKVDGVNVERNAVIPEGATKLQIVKSAEGNC